MHRRFYFVLPDETHALQVSQDLEGVGVDPNHSHAISEKRGKLTQLPPATPCQRHNIVGADSARHLGRQSSHFFDMRPDY